MNDEMENEYLQIVKRYDYNDILGFCELLLILIELLEPEPRDILGERYMSLELGKAIQVNTLLLLNIMKQTEQLSQKKA